MASGRLGAAALAADTTTTVYTVPADTVATVNIGVVNRGADAAATVQVAITPGAAAPAAADWIEGPVTLPPGGVLERSGVVCGPGERVHVRADTDACVVRVHGFEEGL
ncbi:hypothetical protein [Roseospira goensis]|uniref:DUF11 domain-containing protein n=1 Tax=Roseospira goensis TaxID=391922 RepID=A0A7W6S301_9PROT|nr:hypothetical protein [Roseospira goensis]MBB4287963.1 hypothetical protein [Roseospira goensis]